MQNFTIARENMIESQVRPNGITDQRLIAAMSKVPREQFVPDNLKSIAYMDEDIALPVGEGGTRRYLLEPMAFARLVQAAKVQADDIVLDVGGGTGYSAAVLGQLAQTVVAIESDGALVQTANENMLRLEASNVAVIESALKDGYAAEGPYDAIIINGRVGVVPEDLLAQLADGGRLVAVVGTTDVAQARVYTRSGSQIADRHVFDASIPALSEFDAPPPGFQF
ncbi:MAG: protein-L-isoaspartate O-methyltransferase [Anderseniella sp.]|nr:protein-L-isoaspartate O-methyltransferase [Anderseniella sp.]